MGLTHEAETGWHRACSGVAKLKWQGIAAHHPESWGGWDVIRCHLGGIKLVHIIDGVTPNLGHHVQEQIVPLQLVLHQGIPLGVAAQPHSLQGGTKE